MTEINRTQAPSFNQVSSIAFIEPVKTQLDNGVPVYYISGGSEEILKISFIFKAGKWYQPSPLIAASANKLMQEGSKNFTSAEIAEGIDQYGAFLDAEFAYDNANVTVYTLSKHLPHVLPFVKEVIAFPAFSEHEFEVYKQNAYEKFKINLEKVSFVAHTAFMEMLLGKNNPYGKKTEAHHFEQLSLEAIKKFHQQHYNFAHTTIIASGKVTDHDIKVLNQQMGRKDLLTPFTPEVNHPSIAEEINSEKIRHISKADAMQSAIRIGRVMPNKNHPDYFSLQILTTILGGYFGSRLMKNIREDKGYTYGINAGIMSMQQAAFFYINTEVGVDVTDNALAEIYKEIELLQTVLVSDDELALVKNYILGQVLRSCDGPFNMASLFENVHFFGLDFDYYNNYIEKVKNIDAEELKNLAKNYFKKEDLIEVVVGK